MPNGRRLERHSFAEGLRSAITPRLKLSDWADEYRILSKVSSASHGKWVTSRTPYLKEVMDVLSEDDPVQEVVFQKPTQIGGTECGNNWVGQHIHHGVGTMMIIAPTSSGAKKASKTRISPMIADTPVLRSRVREAKSRDSGNTTLMKEFGNGTGLLIFAGANSANDLKSSPVGLLFMDEIEEYPDDVEGQGDPEELATKRSDTFAHQKRFKCSTPTIAGGRVDRAYRASDQRLYFVPCPHCGHRQVLVFERMRWDTRKVCERVDPASGEVTLVESQTQGAIERDTGELLDVWYECAECDVRIQEHYKTQMLGAGAWIQQNPGPDRAAGFKISALYSPIGWFGWRKVVLAWLKSQKDSSGALKKTFTNTVLGEAYEEPGETIDEHYLKRRIEAWRIGEIVPACALVLTAGCDVQGDRLEVRVWGYGRNAESWLIDRQTIYGSPAVEETWTALEQLLDKAWPHELGGTARITAMAIDASDGNTTHFVRMFARKWAPTKRVIAVKGQSLPGKPLIGKPSDQDVSWRGKVIKGGVKLWPMGSDTGKSAFYSRLRIEEPGPGFVHLPNGLPDDAFAQMTAEKLITRYIRGHAKREWHLPSGRRNEDLDCRVMADAAAEYALVRLVNWGKIEAAQRSSAVGDLFVAAANVVQTSAPESNRDGAATAAADAAPGSAATVPGADAVVKTETLPPPRTKPRRPNWTTGFR